MKNVTGSNTPKVNEQQLRDAIKICMHELPCTREEFEFLKSPSEMTKFKGYMGAKIMEIRKGAQATGSVTILRDVHILLAELNALEDTIVMMGGPSIYLK